MVGPGGLSPHKYTSVSTRSMWQGCCADWHHVDVLDGGMIVLALFTLNIFHPGFLLTDDNIIHARDEDSEIVITKKDVKGGAVISESVVAV